MTKMMGGGKRGEVMVKAGRGRLKYARKEGQAKKMGRGGGRRVVDRMA